MNESNFEQSVETGNFTPQEVWIIDDKIELGQTYAEIINSDKVAITSYATAKEALEELADRVQKNLAPPSVIMVDGNLDSDSGDLRRGNAVVKQIRDRLAQLELASQPTIVGWSSMEARNKEMVEAGANFGLPKGHKFKLKDFRNFIDNPTEFKPEVIN